MNTSLNKRRITFNVKIHTLVKNSHPPAQATLLFLSFSIEEFTKPTWAQTLGTDLEDLQYGPYSDAYMSMHWELWPCIFQQVTNDLASKLNGASRVAKRTKDIRVLKEGCHSRSHCTEPEVCCHVSVNTALASLVYSKALIYNSPARLRRVSVLSAQHKSQYQ